MNSKWQAEYEKLTQQEKECVDEYFAQVNEMVDKYIAHDIVALKSLIAECREAADTDPKYHVVVDILDKRTRQYDHQKSSLFLENFLNELQLTKRRGALVQALYDHSIKATIVFEED